MPSVAELQASGGRVGPGALQDQGARPRGVLLHGRSLGLVLVQWEDLVTVGCGM